MDQRKRLIELLCAVECKGDDRREGGCGFRQDDQCNRINKLDMCMIECIANHLLANGVIVPPCKVGDTVYRFSEDFGTVLPYFVDNLRIGFMDKTRNYWVYEANCHDNETDELLDEIDFSLEDIGESVFLTREEAEKALAERSRS